MHIDIEALKIQADLLQKLCIEFSDLYNDFRKFRFDNNITEHNQQSLSDGLKMTHYLKLMQLSYKWRDIGKIEHGQEYMHEKVPAVKNFTRKLEVILKDFHKDLKNG